jgi:hypothetical protein
MWDAYEEVASSKEYTTSTGAPLDEQVRANVKFQKKTIDPSFL